MAERSNSNQKLEFENDQRERNDKHVEEKKEAFVLGGLNNQ